MAQLTTKICLIGEFSVGKTSLVRRYVESTFDERYLSTIGVHISRRIVEVDATTLKLLIWDTAGSEGFGQIVQNYYRGAAGALLVCDLTRADTLPALADYAAAFRAASPGAPLVVVANKADLAVQRKVDDESIAALAATLQAAWFCASARTGAGVAEAFGALSRRIVQGRAGR